ncbi:hypothetical protein HK097_000212, partial [Rhizophlyctis rosea]
QPGGGAAAGAGAVDEGGVAGARVCSAGEAAGGGAGVWGAEGGEVVEVVLECSGSGDGVREVVVLEAEEEEVDMRRSYGW